MEKQQAALKAVFATMALFVISVTAVSFTNAAHAQSSEPTIVFNVAVPNTGTIFFAGGSSPLVGTRINVDSVVGVDTPANDGVSLPCVGCTLSFATGSCMGNCNLNNTDLMFQSGPSTSLSITGSSPVFAGSFVSTPSLLTLPGNFRVIGAAVIGTLDPTVAGFYGLGGMLDGGLNLSFAAKTTRLSTQTIRPRTATVAGLQSTTIYGTDVSLVSEAQ